MTPLLEALRQDPESVEEVLDRVAPNHKTKEGRRAAEVRIARAHVSALGGSDDVDIVQFEAPPSPRFSTRDAAAYVVYAAEDRDHPLAVFLAQTKGEETTVVAKPTLPQYGGRLLTSALAALDAAPSHPLPNHPVIARSFIPDAVRAVA